MPDDEARMTVGEHIEELRRRLLRALLGVGVGAVVCLFFGKVIFQVLFLPLKVATAGRPPNLYFHSLPEAFSTYLRVCLIAGAILASPYGLYQMWRFISAGLYGRERRMVQRFLLPSVVLFAAGVAFFLLIVAPLVMGFFLHFAQSHFAGPPGWAGQWLAEHLGRDDLVAAASRPAQEGGFVLPWLTLGSYVSFVAMLSLAFGVGFQTPLVVLFLVRSGITSIETMRRFRRHVFLLIMIVSAFITPPDWLSMVALSIPMYLLYEVGLLIAGRNSRAQRRPAGVG